MKDFWINVRDYSHSIYLSEEYQKHAIESIQVINYKAYEKLSNELKDLREENKRLENELFKIHESAIW